MDGTDAFPGSAGPSDRCRRWRHVPQCRRGAVRGGGVHGGPVAAHLADGRSGHCRPKGGDLRSQRIERHRDVILAAVNAQVDITLVELATLLRDQHGVSVAPSTIWRFLDRHDMTVKKNGAR